MLFFNRGTKNYLKNPYIFREANPRFQFTAYISNPGIKQKLTKMRFSDS